MTAVVEGTGADLPPETPVCGHCGGLQRGYAKANGQLLCHTDEGMDCFTRVTVLGHPMPCEACSPVGFAAGGA